MTDRTSRYFFSWGPHRHHGDEAFRDRLMEIAGRAFDEDRCIIEAQQRIIDQQPASDILVIGADRALTLYNNLVRRLVDAESSGTA